jgi:hypothetical protein
VYHIFDESSTKGLKECFIFPDWQFIQYILPCFVTLIGQHATNSKTKPTELLVYTRFVHNLIQSFEMKLTIKSVKGKPGTLIQYKPKDVPDWVCSSLAKNLTVQLQEVESDLGMLIYGTQKRMKRADTAEVMQAQVFFRLLKDTLRTTTFERGESTIFRCWGETLLGIVSRTRESILKEVLLPTNPFPTNNLLQALAILHELKNIAATFNNEPMNRTIRELLNVAHQKMKIVLGKQQCTSRPKLETMKRYLEFQKLTVQQLLGAVLFFLVISWRKEMPVIVDATELFRSAQKNVAVEKFIIKDLRGLRSVMTPLLSDKDGNDLSMLPVDFSKKKASPCTLYEQITTLLKSNQSSHDVLRKRSVLGLLPVVPIKMCRCCEKFEELADKMAMCSVCVDNRDFPDIYWFCSSKCETKVLDEGHLEEHAQFLMVKLGLV